jgi:hypothetical protein
MVSMRKQLAAALTAALPRAGYRVLDNEKARATLDRRLVRVSQMGFSRLPEAPQAALGVRFNVRVTSNVADLDAAEDQLTEAVAEVCFALESVPRIRWTEADKVMDGDRLAYDITVTAIARKEP